MAAQREEDFRPTAGRGLGFLGLAVVAAVIGLGLLDPRLSVPLWLYPAALLAGVLVWVTLLRPRIWVGGGMLVLRGMLGTVHVPLAAVETMVVRQVLVVTAGGRRHTSPALGKSRRTLVRSDYGREPSRGGIGSFFGLGSSGSGPGDALGDSARPRALGVDYGEYVESRLVDLTGRARLEARVRPGSPEQAELAAGVRRERAWPEIVALVVAALALVLTLALT